MLNKTIFFLFIVGVFLITGCEKRPHFNYALIDGDSSIANMPFAINEEFVLGIPKKIAFKIANDSIYTSVYISAHAGCPGIEIIPSVKNENEKLFLSIEITKHAFSSSCPVSNMQLNFSVKNKNYKEVYFVIKNMYHPL